MQPEIYCFCSHKDGVSKWFASVKTVANDMEYLSGTVNGSSGVGILTAISRGVSKVDSGSSVKVFSTTGQNLTSGEHKALKREILSQCKAKCLSLSFVVNPDLARSMSHQGNTSTQVTLTRNLSSIHVSAVGSYPSETDDRVDLMARVDKFGNRKQRTILREQFESMWIPVAVICQCGSEVLLEFLGLFPKQNKTVTCQCGWTVECQFHHQGKP